MLSYLQKGDAERPDIGCDGVGFACNTFGCHVVRCADEGVCIASSTEFTTYTKIAELDLTIATKENIRRFDIYCWESQLD